MSKAAVEAEMLEKVKAVEEQNQKVQGLKQQLATVASRQIALERHKKRCTITLQEIEALPEDRPVFRTYGRVFVKTTVDKIKDENKKTIDVTTSEAERLSNEKQRLGDRVKVEEDQLQTQLQEYMNAMRYLQANQKD